MKKAFWVQFGVGPDIPGEPNLFEVPASAAFFQRASQPQDSEAKLMYLVDVDNQLTKFIRLKFVPESAEIEFDALNYRGDWRYLGQVFWLFELPAVSLIASENLTDVVSLPAANRLSVQPK